MLLLKYEFLKLICRKSFWGVLAFCFILNMLLYANENFSQWSDEVSSRERLEILSGTPPTDHNFLSEWLLRNENILNAVALLAHEENTQQDDHDLREAVQVQYGLTLDDSILSHYTDKPQRIYDDMLYNEKLMGVLRHIDQYHSYLMQIQKNALEMQDVSIFSAKDSFAFRNSIKTGNDFKHLDGVPLRFVTIEWVNSVSTSFFTDVLLVVTSIWLCLQIFSYEARNGTDSLIRCTIRGRLTVIVIKMQVLLITVAVLILAFYASMMLSGVFISENTMGALSASIQSIPEFRNCNLTVTVGQYLIFFILGKILSICLFALFVALLYQLTQSNNLSYLFAVVVLISEYLLYKIIHPSSIFSIVKYLNVWAAIDVFSIFSDYKNINFLHIPMGRLESTVIWGIGSFALLLLLTISVYYKQVQFYIRPAIFKHFKSPVEKSTNLLLHEGYNLLISKKVWLFLACTILILSNEVNSSTFYTNNETAAYLICAKSYAGELTQEKMDSIQSLKGELSDAEIELDSLYKQLSGSALSKNDLVITTDKIATLISSQMGIQQFFNQVVYLQSLRTQGLEQVSIESVLSTDLIFFNNSLYLQHGLYAVIILIISLSILFCDDAHLEQQTLVKSTALGRRRLFWVRYGLGVLLTVAVFSILQLSIYINCFRLYKINQWFAPIQSIEMFSKLNWNVSIFTYTATVFTCQLLLLLVLPSVVAALSQLLQRQVFVITISALLFVVPIVLEMIDILSIQLPSINFILLLHTQIAQGHFLAGCSIPVIGFLIVGTLSTWMAYQKYVRLT